MSHAPAVNTLIGLGLSNVLSVDQGLSSKVQVELVALNVPKDHISLILEKMNANCVPRVVTVTLSKSSMVALLLVPLEHSMINLVKVIKSNALRVRLEHIALLMVQKVKIHVCHVNLEHLTIN